VKPISEVVDNVLNDMLEKHKDKFKKYDIEIEAIRKINEIKDRDKRVKFKYYMQYYLLQCMGKHVDEYKGGIHKLYPVLDNDGNVRNEVSYNHGKDKDEAKVIVPDNKLHFARSYHLKIKKMNDKSFKYYMISDKERAHWTDGIL
jgi:hypothetical protein